jgi:hypothetical protein
MALDYLANMSGLAGEGNHFTIRNNLSFVNYIVWTVDFERPVCKIYLLFISADAAQEKERKRRKCCCPLVFQSLQPIQYCVVASLSHLYIVPFASIGLAKFYLNYALAHTVGTR